MSSFRNIYNSLLLILANSSHRALAQQVAYLKAENQILRKRLPGRLIVDHRERIRLIRFAQSLGPALQQIVSIVHPDTMRRWIRESKKTSHAKITPPKPGRRRTAQDIEQLVLKLAKETGWGYTRILGELRKLGIQSLSKNTVKNILKRHGYAPGPERGPGTWDEFLKRHASSLWQCDFFSKKVLTKLGVRDLFVLVFVHVGTRRVYVSPATDKPNEQWVIQQANSFIEHLRSKNLECQTIMHDRDTKFCKSFDDEFVRAEIKVKRAAFRSPNTCAFVERFIQTIKQECLDYFFIFGERHLNYLVTEFVAHYHSERPHQALDNTTPTASNCKRSPPQQKSEPSLLLSDIRCQERLGGLLKHYSRAA